nr:hypothetical protein [Tanacetum cinerariifolium]
MMIHGIEKENEMIEVIMREGKDIGIEVIGMAEKDIIELTMMSEVWASDRPSSTTYANNSFGNPISESRVWKLNVRDQSVLKLKMINNHGFGRVVALDVISKNCSVLEQTMGGRARENMIDRNCAINDVHTTDE